MTATMGLEKIKEVLGNGSEPHLMNGEQYLQSLRDDRRVIDRDGKDIGDVTKHPATRLAADCYSRVYDLQFDPKTRDAMTYVDQRDNKRYSVGWQVPTTKEHLKQKYQALKYVTYQTFGMFGRPIDYGSMMAIGFLSTIDRVEKESKEFADNIRNFVKFARAHNVQSTDLIVDPQSDRRIPMAEKPGRLRIVEERSDGIVLYGSKVAGSVGSISHFFTLSTVLGEDLHEDSAIWCAVPVNAKGLSLVLREPTIDPNADPEDHPLESRVGEELENYILFDHVFLPREYVFSARNLNLLGLYFESCSIALWHILARLSIRAELFLGTAQAITDILGTNKIPGVREMVSEIATYAAATKSFVLASIDEAVEWNGVMVPNPPLVTTGRLYSIWGYPRVQYLLRDMCGQALVSRFPKAIWDDPEIGKTLKEFLPGTGVTAREKNRFFNFVWDLTCGGYASRTGQFENVNATPRSYISELVYQHYERDEVTKYVREFAGISPESHT